MPRPDTHQRLIALLDSGTVGASPDVYHRAPVIGQRLSQPLGWVVPVWDDDRGDKPWIAALLARSA